MQRRRRRRGRQNGLNRLLRATTDLGTGVGAEREDHGVDAAAPLEVLLELLGICGAEERLGDGDEGFKGGSVGGERGEEGREGLEGVDLGPQGLLVQVGSKDGEEVQVGFEELALVRVLNGGLGVGRELVEGGEECDPVGGRGDLVGRDVGVGEGGFDGLEELGVAQDGVDRRLALETDLCEVCLQLCVVGHSCSSRVERAASGN